MSLEQKLRTGKMMRMRMAMMIAMTEWSGRQLGLSCQSRSVHNICFLVTLEKFECALVSDLRTRIWIHCPSVFDLTTFGRPKGPRWRSHESHEQAIQLDENAKPMQNGKMQAAWGVLHLCCSLRCVAAWDVLHLRCVVLRLQVVSHLRCLSMFIQLWKRSSTWNDTITRTSHHPGNVDASQLISY